ncbi:MAG TPA: hypothetical protein VK864_10170, partial [Longimicrobiales bacterium]|nr:hypothetical protein [Longimicrobiales bacterium]
MGGPLLFSGGWQWQQLLLCAHRFKGVSHFLPVTNIRQIVLDYLTASHACGSDSINTELHPRFSLRLYFSKIVSAGTISTLLASSR